MNVSVSTLKNNLNFVSKQTENDEFESPSSLRNSCLDSLKEGKIFSLRPPVIN